MKPRIKRFYKAVEVQKNADGYAVLLDGRPVKSPRMKPVSLPNRALAEALAGEWRAQKQHIDTASMPVMAFAGGVTDALETSPQAARDEIDKYAASDLLCYRAAHPAKLAHRQGEQWDPLLRRFADELGARFELAGGISFRRQPQAAIDAVARIVAGLEGFALAALLQITVLTGSALLAIALLQGWLTPDQAWRLAHLDEDWQAELWGADEDAMQRRAARRHEFTAALLALEL